MPGDQLDALADHLVGDRHRLLRIAGIVADLQHQLLAEHAAGLVDVGDRQLGARFNCAPKVAYWPVIGPTAAIGMSACAVAATPASTAAATVSVYLNDFMTISLPPV